MVSIERWSSNRGASRVVKYTIGTSVCGSYQFLLWSQQFCPQCLVTVRDDNACTSRNGIRSNKHPGREDPIMPAIWSNIPYIQFTQGSSDLLEVRTASQASYLTSCRGLVQAGPCWGVTCTLSHLPPLQLYHHLPPALPHTYNCKGALIHIRTHACMHAHTHVHTCMHTH